MKKKIIWLPIALTALTPTISLVACGDPEPHLNRWYTYRDWWNYCSNGNTTSEATIDDVGKEVDLSIYGKVHKVRLIDVDHIGVDGKTPEAHCTFEFANVITESSGVKTCVWNAKTEKNYDYPISDLNDVLNINNDCIFNKLPDELQSVIKEVNKPVVNGPSFEVDNNFKTKLFALSYCEITTVPSADVKKEGTTYTFYKNDGDSDINRKKNQVDGTEGKNYWLRSAYINSTNHVYFISYNGHWDIDRMKDLGEQPIAPAFCI